MQSVKQGQEFTVTGQGKFLAMTYIAQQTIEFVFDQRIKGNFHTQTDHGPFNVRRRPWEIVCPMWASARFASMCRASSYGSVQVETRL